MNKYTIKTDKAYFVDLLETSGNLLKRLREKSEFYFSPHPKHSPQQIRILNSPLFLY